MKNLNQQALRKSSYFYFALLLCTFLFSCATEKNETIKTEDETNENLVTLTEAQLKNANIKTGTAEIKKVSDILNINGSIELPPQNLISISIPLGGYLKSTSMLPGTPIRKGQTVAIIENIQFIQLQQDYLVSKAKLIYAEQEQSRQMELNKFKAGSDKVLQLAEAEYNSLRITVNSLAEKLRLIGIKPETLTESNINRQIQIKSPINGYISKVNGNIGTYFNPSDILIELIDPSNIHLNLTVFEKDLDKLNLGQKVIAFSNNSPENRHEAEISLISRGLSNERTAEIHCHFKKFDKALTPGMYMNAEIIVKSNQQQAVPEKSIVSFEGKNYLFIEKGPQSFEMKEISPGNTENGYTGLKANLQNQKIVIEGAYILLMHLKNLSEE